MYTDGKFNFGTPAHTDAGSVVSTNILDAGSAKVYFGVAKHLLRLHWKAVISAGTAPTYRVDMVGADNTGLTTLPEKLGSSGQIENAMDGTDLASGDTIWGNFGVGNQRIAKRYYGLMTVLGGSGTPQATASDAYLVFDPQTNLVEQ